MIIISFTFNLNDQIFKRRKKIIKLKLKIQKCSTTSFRSDPRFPKFQRTNEFYKGR